MSDACARCGASLMAGQVYCLECGQRRIPGRRPVHWLWPVGLAALVAAGAAAVAVAAGADSPQPSTIVAVTPLRSAPPPPSADGRRLRSWPRRDGFTVVLAVVPAAGGAKTARARALAGLESGLEDVGVLDSSRYSSLHPGYWVVFSGVFRTLDEALAALPRAARHARDAYAQRITR